MTAPPPPTCRFCGGALEPEVRTCPSCQAPVAPTDSSIPSEREAEESAGPADTGTRSGPRPPSNVHLAELNRRLARLAQWSESAEALGVELPRLPAWADEAAARSRTPEAWAEAARGVERLAQRRLVEAFGHWEERTTARIARLEAYSVDSRLEHSQVEDVVHAAKVGDLAQALATFQQVDRVVALKERHLDQARSDLERLLAFLRDLEALGLVEAGEPTEAAAELERELRTGRLATLKQRLRLLHSRAVAKISESYAEYVARFGDQLAADPRTGPQADGDARELATAARAIVLGHPEEGARRLRALKEARGLSVPSLPTGAARAGAVRPS